MENDEFLYLHTQELNSCFNYSLYSAKHHTFDAVEMIVKFLVLHMYIKQTSKYPVVCSQCIQDTGYFDLFAFKFKIKATLTNVKNGHVLFVFHFFPVLYFFFNNFRTKFYIIIFSNFIFRKGFKLLVYQTGNKVVNYLILIQYNTCMYMYLRQLYSL